MMTLHGVISVKEFKATAEKISLKNTQLRNEVNILRLLLLGRSSKVLTKYGSK